MTREKKLKNKLYLYNPNFKSEEVNPMTFHAHLVLSIRILKYRQ